MEVLDRITTKVGPLPAWAWAAIPAAGYVVWSYYKASQGEGYISDVEEVDETTGEAIGYGINTGGAYLPGYGSVPGGSSNTPIPDQPRFDNLAWSKQAINYLIGEGTPALDAVTAVNAYINGYPTTVTQAQFNALQKAIQKIGPAPEGGYAPQVAPATTPPPAATVTVPEAPTTVALAIASGKATVSWGPPARDGGGAVVGYKVELHRYDTAAKVWKLYASKLTLAGTRSLVFTAGTGSYVAKVFARNIKGYGPAGSSQGASGGTTTPSTTAVPEAPTNVQLGLASSTVAKVSWQPPPRTNGTILAYKVEMTHYDTKTKKWVAYSSKIVLPTTRSATFSVPARNHRFAAKVSARNSKGYGPAAGSQSIITAAK
jgi:hypothetical protein